MKENGRTLSEESVNTKNMRGKKIVEIVDRGGKLVHNNGRDRKKRFEDMGVMARELWLFCLQRGMRVGS